MDHIKQIRFHCQPQVFWRISGSTFFLFSSKGYEGLDSSNDAFLNINDGILQLCLPSTLCWIKSFFSKKEDYSSTQGWWSRWWFQTFFIFIPKIGEDEPILTSIFFRWVGKNHQPMMLMMTTWGVPLSRTKPLRLATVSWPCHRSGIGNFCWAWQALGPLRMVPFTRGEKVGLWQMISWSKVEFSHKKNCTFNVIFTSKAL